MARADHLIVLQGHAPTRSAAHRLIDARAAQWLSPQGWVTLRKAGEDLPETAQFRVTNDDELRWVSRAGLKLEGALGHIGLDVTGLNCLDVGQSTGGFTDCLLQHGAAQVIGVDVGHGQLHDRLRSDLRVVCVEGVNARSLTAPALQQACDLALSEVIEAEEDNETQPEAPYSWMRNGGQVDEEYDDSNDAKDKDIETFKSERAARAKAREQGTLPIERRRRAECANVDITPVFDVVTGDLSFISLTLVLPALVPLLAPGGSLLMLVKPQFELQPGQVGKGGIVRDASLYAVVEQRIRDCCAELGLEVQAWLDSPISGGDGNREFFVFARRGA